MMNSVSGNEVSTPLKLLAQLKFDKSSEEHKFEICLNSH